MEARAHPPLSSLLVVHRGGERLAGLEKVLAGTPVKVELAALEAPLPPARAFDAVLLDYDALPSQARSAWVQAWAQFGTTSQLLLMSEGSDRHELATLFSAGALRHLLAPNCHLDAADLSVTLDKLRTGNIFGLGRYVAAPPITFSLTSSRDKARALVEVDALADRVGLPPRLKEHLLLVADEFVTNAVYNAPVDAEGRFRFADRSRDRRVKLGEGEEIQVQIASDQERIGLSVSDPFGSLSESRVFESMARCFRKGADQIETKAGGAGLGLYYTFESLSSLVVNLAPGHRTEMIGLLNIGRSFRDFARQSKSFHFFFAEAG